MRWGAEGAGLREAGSRQITVEWQALSNDGHKTNGSYSFTVTP
ncbi:copper resistance protein CopC [Rhizobium acidisoli]